MITITDLPTEILLKLLGECRILKSVCKQFYRLNNEEYRERTLSWLSCGTVNEYKWFWDCCEEDVRNYVESLDFLRQDARRIVKTDLPYIEDSWEVIYRTLNSTLNCRNNSDLMRSVDSLDFHRPIFTGRSTLPYFGENSQIPINAWFHVKSLEGTFKLATLVTEIRISPYDKYKTTSMPANIRDFINEPGIYCFNMGKVPKFDISESTAKPPIVPFEIRLMERSMTPPSYFEHSDLIFLGYDFVQYDKFKPWLFFCIDEEFKNTIFNPLETCLSESFVKFTRTFRHSNNLQLKKISMQNDFEPYFNEKSKAIRYFNYKYPKDRPDLEKEKRLPDWRAPHLKF